MQAYNTTAINDNTPLLNMYSVPKYFMLILGCLLALSIASIIGIVVFGTIKMAEIQQQYNMFQSSQSNTTNQLADLQQQYKMLQSSQNNTINQLADLQQQYKMLQSFQNNTINQLAAMTKDITANSLLIGTVVGWQSKQAMPPSYMLCDGKLLNITDYPELFNLLGTIYGSQPGMFGVPDFRGRSLIGGGTGPGLSSRDLGAVGGKETISLTANQNGVHTHTYNAWVSQQIGGWTWQANQGYQSLQDTMTTQPSGAGDPHENMQPFGVTIWYIKCK